MHNVTTLPNRRSLLPRIRYRRTLLASALLVQMLVLTLGWAITFRYVRGRLAEAVREYIVQENTDLVEGLAAKLPRDGSDPNMIDERDLERWQSEIENATNLPGGAFACILDAEGNIRCHPDLRREPGLLNVNLADKVIGGGTLGDRRVRLAEAQDETISGRIEFIADGTHYVATKKIPGTEYRLIVHQPEKELFDAGNDITSTVFAGGLLAAALVTLVSGGCLIVIIRSYDSVIEEANRRLKGDLQIARDIQQATFPNTVPTLAGFDLAAWSTPAEETGGDTFDLIPLGADGSTRTSSPDECVLLLADAAGHGIGPALAVAELRSILRTAVRMGAGLRTTVRHLNEQLHADLPSGRFVTAWIGRLNISDATLDTYSGAQGPVLVFRAATTSVEQRMPDDVPFGIMDEFGNATVEPLQLNDGDVVLAVSDGIFEAAGQTGEMFGIERTEAALREQAAASAEAIAEAIRSAVHAFAPGAPDDDRTVVVLKKLG